MIILYLTCATDEEAKTISDALLRAKLIACAHRSSIDSAYWWKGKLYDEPETLLTMQSTEEKFDEVEATVAKLHSYEQHVLTAVPVAIAAPGVKEWLEETLQ